MPKNCGAILSRVAPPFTTAQLPERRRVRRCPLPEQHPASPAVPSAAEYTYTVRLACVMALCGLLIPCAHAQKRKMIQVDDSSSGREVALQVGQKLEVSLSENASTGYRWSVPTELKNKLAPVLRQLEETVQAHDGPPGKPGVRHLYFEAVAAGAAALEIQYRRPWEQNTPPARTFKLRVLVPPAPAR